MAYFKTRTINIPRTQHAAVATTDSIGTEEGQADFYADEGVTFESLGIHPFVQLALKQAGFNKPAHVQVGERQYSFRTSGTPLVSASLWL